MATTLSVDGRVVSRAKRYARKQGISASQMVEAYLEALAEPSAAASPDSAFTQRVSEEGDVEARAR